MQHRHAICPSISCSRVQQTYMQIQLHARHNTTFNPRVLTASLMLSLHAILYSPPLLHVCAHSLLMFLHAELNLKFIPRVCPFIMVIALHAYKPPQQPPRVNKRFYIYSIKKKWDFLQKFWKKNEKICKKKHIFLRN